MGEFSRGGTQATFGNGRENIHGSQLNGMPRMGQKLMVLACKSLRQAQPINCTQKKCHVIPKRTQSVQKSAGKKINKGNTERFH